MNWKPFGKPFGKPSTKGMVKHDRKACLIALPNFIKYNQPESPNVVKAWVNSLDLLPECDLKNDVISLSANALKGYSKAFREALPEAFLKTYPKSMPNQEQEQEQELLIIILVRVLKKSKHKASTLQSQFVNCST